MKIGFVNTVGQRQLAEWVKKNSNLTMDTPEKIEAWCREAEDSLGAGNPPMVEMSAKWAFSNRPETFTVSPEGIDWVEVDD